jgi:hypothetical protein
MARKPTQIVQIKLRLPERLRREVEKLAKQSGRSLNGQLVFIIEDAIQFGALSERLDEVSQTLQTVVNRIEVEAARVKSPEEQALLARLKELHESAPENTASEGRNRITVTARPIKGGDKVE